MSKEINYKISLPDNSYTPKELWENLQLGDKSSNSQMDVVLALWENNPIIK